MNYSVIFAGGHEDDSEFFQAQRRNDVLLLDGNGNYYRTNYITLNRINSQFEEQSVCYSEPFTIILHEITTENILKSLEELHKRAFYKNWLPLSEELLIKYYPKDDWVIHKVEVEEKEL